MDRCPARVIGVTGTKGKSTTCALIAQILGEAGWRTWTFGDTGRSPMDFVDKVRASHLVVLELSSDDLLDADTSPHIAVCVELMPGYHDSHRNLREAVAAQGNIFWRQQVDDVAVFNARNEFSAQIGQLSPGRHTPYLQAPGARVNHGRLAIGDVDICSVSDLVVPGEHTLANICAAVTAAWDLTGQNASAVQRAVQNFRGLPHRLEMVREADRIWYVNDSSSVIPESAAAALRSYGPPKVVVLGGADRPVDYGELALEVAGSNVRFAVLMGEAAGKLQVALEKAGFKRAIMGPRTMAEIVVSARALAQPGDVVLLSPGCPATDGFRDWKDRGDKYKAQVLALA
jgi:UDP-N-acetylmuramoylalanine--D-glutamate ligase